MKTIVIHPLDNVNDYERLFDIKAYGAFEYESNYFEWWSWNNILYRIDKQDIEWLKEEDRY